MDDGVTYLLQAIVELVVLRVVPQQAVDLPLFLHQVPPATNTYVTLLCVLVRLLSVLFVSRVLFSVLRCGMYCIPRCDTRPCARHATACPHTPIILVFSRVCPSSRITLIPTLRSSSNTLSVTLDHRLDIFGSSGFVGLHDEP